MDRFVETDGFTTHYLEFAGGEPTLILLPGLTANASSFGGLIGAGLSPAFRVLALDLRGRGLSDRRDGRYTMEDHAGDVIEFMDALALERAMLVGHSFGGLLALYLGAHFPDRFHRLITIDTPPGVDPVVAAQIRPSLERLDRPAPSWDAYLAAVKAQPSLAGWWDSSIEEYFRADVRENPDGTVQARSLAADIQEAADGVLEIDWTDVISRVRQPTLAVRAREPYGPVGSPPILTQDKANVVMSLLANGTAVDLPGNHITVLFGEHASLLRDAIADFVTS